MLLKLVFNSWSCHLHSECGNSHSQHWDFVRLLEAGAPTGVLRSAPIGVLAAAHAAPLEEHCSSQVESAGE
jgi:hypothetical protein